MAVSKGKRKGVFPSRYFWSGAFSVFIVSMLVVPRLVVAGDLIHYYRLAKVNDLKFQATASGHLASRQFIKQANSKLMPALSAELESGLTTQDIISSDNALYQTGKTNNSTNTYGLTLSQPLYNYASLAGLDQAKAKMQLSDAELLVAEQELIVRVAELYLRALAANDNLTFARAEKNAVERHYETAVAKLKAGVARVTDLHDSKARHELVLSSLYEAEILLDDAMEALREVSGEPVTGLTMLQETFAPDPPEPAAMEPWLDSALEHNVALVLKKYELEVARQEIRQQNAGHFPTLDLVGRYNVVDTSGNVFGGGSNVANNDILVRMNVPLFQGGYVASKVKEATALSQQAQNNFDRQRRAVERETKAAFHGVGSSIRKAEALRQAVISQEIALNAKEEGFKADLFTGLAVLDAERDLYMAKRDFAKARYDYIFNTLKLKQAVGTLADKDVEEANQWLTAK